MYGKKKTWGEEDDLGDEQGLSEGTSINRPSNFGEIKTLQGNYDSNDERPIKPSSLEGKYDLKMVSLGIP